MLGCAYFFLPCKLAGVGVGNGEPVDLGMLDLLPAPDKQTETKR
jgi:hypothetical protein